MQLQLDPEAGARILGVTFGIVTINNVTVQESDARLWELITLQSEEKARTMTMEDLPNDSQITAVRGLQKLFGFDPGRYRPSSEALLRRVLKGQGLYQINTAVDVNNLCSLEFGLPMCVYDLKNVVGQIRVRLGASGEEYPGIGRQHFQIENKIIIADDQGVMGTTVSDSERTKVTSATRDIFMMIYAPPGFEAEDVHLYTALAGRRMVQYNGGEASDVLALTVK